MTGTQDAVVSACRLIFKEIERVGAQVTKPVFAKRKKYSNDDEEAQVSGEKLTFLFPVHAVHCGAIIGHGGANIREIRENSGCNVEISRQNLPNSTDRMVRIDLGQIL